MYDAGSIYLIILSTVSIPGTLKHAEFDLIYLFFCYGVHPVLSEYHLLRHS